MSERHPTEESFLKDVEKHEMKVMHDDGLYRHLRFAATGELSWNQWFEIITWPGKLAYSGDMGTYVFARLEDMFRFFRTRPKDGDENLHINLSYWGEKLEAVDRVGRLDSGYRTFSAEKLKREVEEHSKEWIEDKSEEFKDLLREEIEGEIYAYLDDGEVEARQALDRFDFEYDGEHYRFQDSFEWNFETYTYRYVWCCYAIAWAIKQYDTKEKEESKIGEEAITDSMPKP